MKRGSGTMSSCARRRRSALPSGSIKATVLIETILASFEMDEILYELRDHSAGLNCGRWDYIFSFIKKFSSDPQAVLPDRAQVTMTTHFMRSYSKLAIKTCHKRNVHAMGGMSAYIPDQDRSGGQRKSHRASAGRQGARGQRRPRRHLGGASRPGARGDGDLRPPDAASPIRFQSSCRITTPTADDLLQVPDGTDYRGRTETERRRRPRLPGGVAARHRLRAALQPDGRRSDRGDQPRAAVAVDTQPARNSATDAWWTRRWSRP